MTLAHPHSQLLTGLTSNFSGTICPTGLKNPKSLLGHSDGTAAYVARSEVSGSRSSYTFVRNKNYRGGRNLGRVPTGKGLKNLVLKVV